MRGLLELAGLGVTLLAASSFGNTPAPAESVLGAAAPAASFGVGPEEVQDGEAAQPALDGAAEALEPAGLPRSVDRNLGFGMLHIPQGFRTDRCDLVIHFHGAGTTVTPQFDRAGLGAALLLINAGVQSGPYESRYSDVAALERTLLATQKGMDDALGAERCSIGRLALSAWSAGYGAVVRILAHDRNDARVDAVLLADGMHAGYRNRRSRAVDPAGMRPFTRFAALAADGHKLMAVTHSSIVTSPYASTTETASFLIEETGLGVDESTEQGPGTMVMNYRADGRGLHIKGFEGGDAAAHCDHLYRIGDTLYSDLRERWSTR